MYLSRSIQLMSDEQDKPVNITIKIADTVPLQLHRELQAQFYGARHKANEMEQQAAEIRIELAAAQVRIRQLEEDLKLKGEFCG